MVFKDKKGIALVTALLILLALSVIGVIAVNTTVTDTKISGNLKGIRLAFYLADAGISHAGVLIKKGVDTIEATYNLGEGSYTITISNVGTLKKVVSTGKTSTGANNATLEGLFIKKTSPDDAITTNEDLEIKGNVTVDGSNATAHSNSDLEIEGSVKIDTSSASGKANPDPPHTSNAPKVDILTIDPTKFACYAEYQLKSDGKVYKVDKKDCSLTKEPTDKDGSWYGWRYKPGEWKKTDNKTPPPAMLYIEGDAEVSGGPGSVSKPWETALIATGDLKISGNPTIAHYRDPSDPIEVQNLLFVAGGEKIKISGNLTQPVDGIIAAHGNIEVSGKGLTLNEGCIIAENATDEDENDISGNSKITYNGGMASPFINKVIKIGWRQDYE